MARRSYAGGASGVALTASATDVATSLSVNTLVGVPNGSAGPFAICVGKGTVNEEKMLISSASAGIMSVSQRGYDGTTPRSHSAGEEVILVITATDADEANAHVNATTGVHGAGVGVPLATTSSAQTLTNKSMDGDLNTFTDLPLSSMPAIVAALDAEEAARAAGDADRYTKAEADSLFATPTETEAYTDAAMASHEGAADPHDQYLMHDGTATKNVPLSAFPAFSLPQAQASSRKIGGLMSSLQVTDAQPIKTLGSIVIPPAVEANGTYGRLWLVVCNIKGFTTSGTGSDTCKYGISLKSDASAWWPTGLLDGPRQNQRLEGGQSVSANGLLLWGLFTAATTTGSGATIRVEFEKLSGSCNPTAVADEDGLSYFGAVQLT